VTIPAADPQAGPRLAAVLAAGGIAIIACDTIYGLVGRVPAAEARLREIKGRGETRPFLQLISDPEWVTRFSPAAVPPGLSRHWPGPLTIILPARTGGTVALRVPDSPFLRDLIRVLGVPLYSTSVNTSGTPALWRISEIRESFESLVDIILDSGDLPEGVASTIVDATTTPCRVIREGAAAVAPRDLEGRLPAPPS
jgi:L-threonylcarbamoyladenylate synthase